MCAAAGLKAGLLPLGQCECDVPLGLLVKWACYRLQPKGKWDDLSSRSPGPNRQGRNHQLTCTPLTN